MAGFHQEVSRASMFLTDIDRFVSSAKTMVFKALEIIFRSLMCKIESNEPRIDRRGMAHIIS